MEHWKWMGFNKKNDFSFSNLCVRLQIKGQSGDTFARCEIVINACSGFTYEYILYVNGKQFKTFREKQSRIMRTWHFEMNGKEYRVVLGIVQSMLCYAIDYCFMGPRERHIGYMGQRTETTDHSVSTQIDSVWKIIQSRTASEFADEGTEMGFDLDIGLKGCIKTVSSGNKKQGMIYVLMANDTLIEESSTWFQCKS